MGTDEENELVTMLLADDVRENPLLGVRALKEREIRLEAAVRVPDTQSKPRFVVCENWTHPFDGDGDEVEVRWVFDRRAWKLVSSFVRAGGSGDWRSSTPEENRDLEESLILANGEVLTDVSMWDDCFECERIPSWVDACRTPPGLAI